MQCSLFHVPSVFVRLTLGMFLIVLLSTFGCGSDNAPAKVSGTITLDGKPLAGVIVSFQPKGGGRSSEAMTDASGKYSLRFSAQVDGALVGSHTVLIGTSESSTDENGKPVKPEIFVPAKYNTKSELTAEVKAGRNKVDFALTSQ